MCVQQRNDGRLWNLCVCAERENVCVCVYRRETCVQNVCAAGKCVCVCTKCVHACGVETRGGPVTILRPTAPPSIALLINHVSYYHKQCFIFIVITNNMLINDTYVII